jgi:hypothetical protein
LIAVNAHNAPTGATATWVNLHLSAATRLPNPDQFRSKRKALDVLQSEATTVVFNLAKQLHIAERDEHIRDGVPDSNILCEWHELPEKLARLYHSQALDQIKLLNAMGYVVVYKALADRAQKYIDALNTATNVVAASRTFAPALPKIKPLEKKDESLPSSAVRNDPFC